RHPRPPRHHMGAPGDLERVDAARLQARLLRCQVVLPTLGHRDAPLRHGGEVALPDARLHLGAGVAGARDGREPTPLDRPPFPVPHPEEIPGLAATGLVLVDARVPRCPFPISRHGAPSRTCCRKRRAKSTPASRALSTVASRSWASSCRFHELRLRPLDEVAL